MGPYHRMDPQDWKNFKIHFWVQDQNFWNGPLPKSDIWWKFWKILLFHVLSKDACKFAINLFPITRGPFEDVNLLYFLLKMQIWNGCNVLNIVENPIKVIQCKSFISKFKVKSCGMDPPLEKFWTSFLSSGSKVGGMDTSPSLTSGGNFGKSTFPCTVQSCMQICHKPFPHHLRTIWRC